MRQCWKYLLLIAASFHDDIKRATAFVVPSQKLGKSRIAYDGSYAVKSTSLLQMMNWEEIMYGAQSTANNLASLSLQDPSNLVTSLPIMYAAGLLTSLSPCVWGLLPLTMSYISQAAGERSDQKTTLPTLAFASGLAVVFCSLGVAAAELGGIFGGSGDNTAGGMFLPITSYTICLLMGFKLLELIQIPLPSLDFGKTKQTSTQTDEPILLDETGRILTRQSRQQQGSLFRTFLLGGSSALVASPCATPVLTSILAFVAKAQNPALGALLLFGYTLGYSTPLLLVASTGGQALVKLRSSNESNGWYASLAPWVSPLTGGILLWYGTKGMLTAVVGDPSLAGLAPILE